jgi:tetratricopeptide (TPR) repeat protein
MVATVVLGGVEVNQMTVAHRYLEGLTDGQQARLAEINRPGLAALRHHLSSGRGVAFLGAGTSAPLYPLWHDVIAVLIDVARDDLSDQVAGTCRAMAVNNPDAVVELVRRHLGQVGFREVLRQVFRARRDPVTGRTWTPVQELVARCGFAGVVTTNYDPGIVNSRMAVRPFVSGTGFASWTDDDALDRWRTGDVFGGDELPVLYAHGHHNQPDAMVLATTEYRRAYAGKLAAALKALADSGHLVWIGFSFADQRIAAILREVGECTGTGLYPGGAPRHVAIMPWEPTWHGMNDSKSQDPRVIRDIMEIQYGCRTILYPAAGGNHSALSALLDEFTLSQFPAVAANIPQLSHVAGPSQSPGQHDEHAAGASDDVVVRWVHGGIPIDYFTGRAEELARLDRWADDPEVRLIGVTAWGGAGKTALVTRWVNSQRHHRPVRGVFGWSFYENPSAEEWANELLAWAEKAVGYRPGPARRLPARVLELVRQVPLLLILDGLEGSQEAPAGQEFGRFLDNLLRAVLTGFCQRAHSGLAVLTSRFPFADLESFDGAAARMLDVPPFTPAEGAELLGRTGGDWVPEPERRSLAEAVDGHALAVGVLATTLRDRPPESDMVGLRHDLEAAGRTDARVGRVLQFYADRLNVSDRMLVAIVSLFARPVRVTTVLAIGDSEAIGRPISGCTPSGVEEMARGRLAGLLTWHPESLVSAHPLVRGAFRPLILTGDTARLASNVALADLPAVVFSHDEALRVVEMIELLLEAGQWTAADDLHFGFMDRGTNWARIPAARLGERCALAFVGTENRRRACREQLSAEHLARYINHAGLYAMLAGDMTVAESFLEAALAQHDPDGSDLRSRSVALQRLSGCLYYQGHAVRAREAAEQAVELALTEDDFRFLRNAVTTKGAALDLAGETAEAERCFIEADRIQSSGSGHLYSLGGALWGDLLVRTGRLAAARQLTEANREICEANRWNHGIARCDRLLARCDLAEGDPGSAQRRLDSAARTFDDGDFLIELAMTLPDVAEHRRLDGDLDDAERLCTETIKLAGPRQLVPSHARALSVRARIRADRLTGTAEAHLQDRARDDADHAMRLSTMIRHLPWQELDALQAHAHIDAAEQYDQGWQQRASELRTKLIPGELQPNPLKDVIPVSE